MTIDIDEITLILSGVKILQDLDVEIVNDIARNTEIAEFKQGDMVVRAGEIGERIYFIYNGRLEVQVPDLSGEVKRRILVKKGEVVGEISLLVESTYSADIVALTDASAFYLDRSRFKLVIERHPDLAEVMSQLMTNRMAHYGGINRVGKYELRGKLGEGSMATVFNAWDPDLEREVAVKMLKYKLAYDEVFLDRFEREAKTIASLNHPNIINVYEVIDASALHYAHNHGEKGIVHRDIKPSNIVLDAHGNIKLTDFGIACPPQNKEVNIEGTPSYLAPEIIRGDLLDGRADIYAMGVMAFHMLTASLPFSAATLSKLLQMQLQQTPPDIRNTCPDIDQELAEFIESALSKEPQERISDWQEIRRILKPPSQLKLMLDPQELAIVIRFRDTAYQQSATLINTMQRLLKDEDINHQIEMHRGDNTNS